MPAGNTLQTYFEKIRHNKGFEAFVITVIVISALTVGARTYPLPNWFEIGLSWLDTFITIFFIIEIGIRFAGEKTKWRFFINGWNLFDTIIVVASLMPIENSDMAVIGRLLRIFRVLRMVSIIPELRLLLNSLIKALPQLGYVVLLMFIIFYIYAAIGATMFADINETLWGDITVALLTLFRVMTFEDWTDVMYETMTVYPLSWIYYLTFIFFTAFAFLNMVIGIVINVMEEESRKQAEAEQSDERIELVWLYGSRAQGTHHKESDFDLAIALQIALYDIKKDFMLNIKDNFLHYESFIFEEGINILKKDLNDISTYSSILYAISLGNNKIGDIAEFLDLKSTYLTRYLQKLVDIMIISKKIPINDDIKKSKFGRYEIEDNFIKFWFCYVFPNYSKLQKGDFYSVISHIRNDFTKRLVRTSYKKHIFNIVSQDPYKFFGFIPKNIGSWWNNKDIQIDIIAYDSKNIIFCDCKYKQNETLEISYKLLNTKSLDFKTTLNKKYIIFSKNNLQK